MRVTVLDVYIAVEEECITLSRMHADNRRHRPNAMQMYIQLYAYCLTKKEKATVTFLPIDAFMCHGSRRDLAWHV